MKTKKNIMSVFISAVVLVLMLTMTVHMSYGATLTVDDSGGADYTKIQDAINNSSAGDTILVYSGTYYENVNVNKSLVLRGVDNGSGKPIVDAGGNDRSAIILSAGNSTLEGFIVVNTTAHRTYGKPIVGGITIVSNNNTISNNIASNNRYYGINLYNSNNNTLNNNTALNNNEIGIDVWFSNNNTLNGNTALNNIIGIDISASSNNTLINNIMTGNNYNFRLDNYHDSDFNNQIDTSNMVDGKPIYYIRGASNRIYDYSTNAGTFYCINCINITIKNLSLNKNDKGIFFWKTNFSRIQNVSSSISLSHSIGNNMLSNNNGSISLSYSSDNTISNNIVSKDTRTDTIGISLTYSSNNTISNNTASNRGAGIILTFSDNDTLSNNNVSNNYDGIDLWYSSNNTISNNIASNNSNSIYLLSSDNNILSSNNISNNSIAGVYLYYISKNNTIRNNVITNNYKGIYMDSYVTNNTISNNTISNNYVGIWPEKKSINNMIYHNNFITNRQNVIATFITPNTTLEPNIWNASYPSGGNYWDNYKGTDNFSGSAQNQLGSDGIGDIPYNITNIYEQDRYPFMKMNGWLSTDELRGDVNRNGKIDTGDATIILRYLAGHLIPPKYQPLLPIGDMNCNKRIDTGDATIIIKIVIGKTIKKCW